MRRLIGTVCGPTPVVADTQYLAPFFALYLYGAACGGGAGRVARFLASPIQVALGSHTMAVYFFHILLVKALQLFPLLRASTGNGSIAIFLATILLWPLCIGYGTYVEPSLLRCVGCGSTSSGTL